MRLDAEQPLERLAHRVELPRWNGEYVPAPLAQRVLVALRPCELVEPRAVPEVDMTDEPDPLQRLEVPIDGREVGGGERAVEASGDLLRARRPLDGEERLEDEPAGTRHPELVRTYDGERVREVTSDMLVVRCRDGHFRGRSLRSSDVRYSPCSHERQLRFDCNCEVLARGPVCQLSQVGIRVLQVSAGRSNVARMTGPVVTTPSPASSSKRPTAVTVVTHLEQQYSRLALRVEGTAGEVKGLRRELAEAEAISEGLSRQIEAYKRGQRLDPRAHIKHAAAPTVKTEMRFEQAADLWAALSLSVLLIGLVALIIVHPDHILAWITVFVIAIVLAESFLRGTFVRTVNRTAVLLALVAVFILLVHFWKWAILGALVGLAAFLLVQRVRELRA